MIRLALLGTFIATAFADEATHEYADGDEVLVWANKLGPFNNPLETYSYFSLPFCPPAKRDGAVIQRHTDHFGESLLGDELRLTHIDARFKRNREPVVLCTKHLVQRDVARFALAIHQKYWYNFVVDGLPMWAYVGEIPPPPSKEGEDIPMRLFTMQTLRLGYNGRHIVEASIVPSEPVVMPCDGHVATTAVITEDADDEKYVKVHAANGTAGGTEVDIQFRFAIVWYESNITFDRRFSRYLDHSFFEHRIHWMSIANSFMIVLVLAGLVGVIVLRTSRADAEAFATLDDEDGGPNSEETVIKQIHRDVFRPPRAPEWLAAIVGQGVQLAVAALAILLSSFSYSELYLSKGLFVSASVFFWFVSAFVGGMASGATFRWFSRLSPDLTSGWKKVLIIVWALYPCVIATVGMAMNMVAWIGYQSQQAIPFLDLLTLLLLFLLQFALVILGTNVGRHYLPSVAQDALPRVTQYPRGIPRRPWYSSRLAIIAVSGCLPFASVQVELYFIMAALWHYKFYYVFGHAILVFVNYILTSMCVGAVVAYLLASKEDHRWHWVTVGVGAAAGVYMYADAVYFFFNHTKMTGLLMVVYYFGYMAIFCLSFAFICGPWCVTVLVIVSVRE